MATLTVQPRSIAGAVLFQMNREHQSRRPRGNRPHNGRPPVFHERPDRSDAWLSCVGPGELAPDLENCAYRSPNNGSLAARWLRGRSSPLEFSTMLNVLGITRIHRDWVGIPKQ